MGILLVCIGGFLLTRTRPAGADAREVHVLPLNNGLTFQAKLSERDGEIYIENFLTSDRSVYDLAVIASLSPYTDFQPAGSLRDKGAGVNVAALEKRGNETFDHFQYNHFALPYKNRADYDYEFRTLAMVTLKDAYDFEIPLDAKKRTAQNLSKDFPDEGLIRVLYAEIAESSTVDVPNAGCKALAAVRFEIREGLHYQLRITDASVAVETPSEGIRAGEKANQFVYYHPIAEGESSITLRFEALSYPKVIEGSVALRK